MNKAKLVLKIIAQLEEEMELYFKVARASHEEATHEQSKAENKYDTRGLEASYLAGGQARQAAETRATLEVFRNFALKKFAVADGIDLSALVEIQSGTETSQYFIAPRGGGIEVTIGKKEIFVLSPQSPLGQQLMGLAKGAKFKFGEGRNAQHCAVVSVE